MWLLAFVIYCGCKWLTWQRTAAGDVPAWLHLGYLVGWPGLDAVAFLGSGRASAVPRPGRSEWWFALGKMTAGVAVLFLLVRRVPAEYPYLVGWVGMVGIVLVLHFGSFHLLSCAWRRAGVDARPLMNWPLASVSLSDFWGRRWNTAFRDLTHRFLFRPLTPRLGARGAVFAGFVFSGVVHDAVLSLPSSGGYGGPTIFFVLQGLGILVERSRAGRAVGLGTGWRGWLFTMTLLLVPLGLLFHPPFVTRVVVPFLQAVGAI
jgi:alginate O-acetyltransferase complex protein AlgI